jgi:integrase
VSAVVITSLGQCFQHWLVTKQALVREPTWRDYEEKARRYLIPRLGRVAVRNLTPARISGYYVTLRQEGLSPRSVWYMHEILMQVLEHAVGLRLITLNPARQVRPERYRRQERGHLTPGELARFLATAANDEHAALWHLLGAGGLRPSEALALWWDDVDLEQGSVNVQCTIRALGDGRWERLPLPHAGQRRQVQLTRRTIELLGEHWRRTRLARQETAFVFTDAGGAPLAWKRVSRRHFPALLQRAGLPTVPPFSLRHSCVTMLLSTGMDLQSISIHLGYTSLTRMLEHNPIQRGEAEVDRMPRQASPRAE